MKPYPFSRQAACWTRLLLFCREWPWPKAPVPDDPGRAGHAQMGRRDRTDGGKGFFPGQDRRRHDLGFGKAAGGVVRGLKSPLRADRGVLRDEKGK